MPISLDARAVQTKYEALIEQLRSYCEERSLDPHLVQFYRDTHYNKEDPLYPEYRKAWTRLSAQAKNFFYTYGSWMTASSVHALPLEPLHGELRISTHTIKWVVIFAVEYYQWIGQACNRAYRDANHAADFVVLSTDEVLHHFRHCCRLKFSIPEKMENLHRLTIKNSMSILTLKE